MKKDFFKDSAIKYPAYEPWISNDDINSVSNIIDESLQSLELKKQWSSNE